MAGTVMPIWRPQFLDANGAPLASGTVETYESGTSTPLATYSNEGLSVSNGTTITLNAGGFPQVSGVEVAIFLLPRAYRFVLKNSAGTTQRTIDGVYAVQAATAVNLEVDGTAGEALTAGDWAYQSDGSNSLTAGRWYKADADLYYASIHPNIGYVPASIASGGTGTIRVGGVADGLSALSAGSTYYLSATAGAITTTAPANGRPVGVARSATAIDMSVGPRWMADGTSLPCEGRLSSSTGNPIGTGAGSASVYFVPYGGSRIALYTGSAWRVYNFTEVTSLLSGGTASRPHDVFIYDNAGTLTLDLVAWTNGTTRATALTTQNGVYVKTGATARRYLGTIYLNSSKEITESATQMFVWNYYNRVRRILTRVEDTNSWTYTTATWRQANGSALNQFEIVVGVAESLFECVLNAHAYNDTANVGRRIGIGEDATNAPDTGSITSNVESAAANAAAPMSVGYRSFPAIGYHFYAWLENSDATTTTTWLGDNGGTVIQSGMMGSIDQ